MQPSALGLDRVIIVGNAPSAAFPDTSRLPASAPIVRLPWFFLEGSYHVGAHADLIFTPMRDAVHDQLLADELRAGAYTAGTLATLQRLHPARDLVRDVEDAWEPMTRHARLARAFMISHERPSDALQALAYVLLSGAREVWLVGLDAYRQGSLRSRFGVNPMGERATQLTGRPSVGFGPSDDHQIDIDRRFLSVLLDEIAGVDIRVVGACDGLDGLLPAAQPLRENLAERPPSRLGVLKRTRTALTGEQAVLTADPVDPADQNAAPALIDGRRCAFVTLVSGDYHHGARALAHSLAKVSDVPLVAMCGMGADVAALRRSGITTVEVPDIVNPHDHYGSTQGRFAATFTKLNAFRMTFLDRAVFVDSDAIVLRSIDDLFRGEGFAAVRDNGFEIDLPGFNSGVFAFEPSRALFDAMMAQVGHLGSDDGGDQGFLNSFLGEGWLELPREYNTTKRVYAAHPALFDLDRVKVLHYVGAKPWTLDASHVAYAALNDLWFSFLAADEARELLAVWSRASAATQANLAEGPTPISLRHAAALLESGDHDEAAEIARADLGRHPRSVRALKVLIKAHLGRRDLGRAGYYAARTALAMAGNKASAPGRSAVPPVVDGRTSA